MSTLEDKILGEKLHYYCSSSSEDDGNDSGDSDKECDDVKYTDNTAQYIAPSYSEWDGTSSNTGPKGVIKDWQRYKQLEAEKRESQEKERLQLINKLSLTCRSALDEEKEKLNETDPELANLLSDEFLLEYQKQRMKEMLAKTEKLFGRVIDLENTDQFLQAIDGEDKSIIVIVHIYEDNVSGCEAMNGCLISLAEEYPYVKFCKILGSIAGLSKQFKKFGVPTLLVYKNGQVIGNFIHVTDHLGVDFYSSDVEAFLIEHGILADKNCIPLIVLKNENKVSDSE
ncbi:PREDICTED: phosducin-like protein [Acromyrmex echinatior]|uniref:Phosducin-like protein n=1 Tax=Acromyrmex echinatior TaxID=103372 RepID=F4W4B3_ACREC|nr:PREDICTED: phosducin-like protein [Acromyrmex echinatior]EGI70957.1 Phosducin-like protein [Acromyrmex echinatior]